MLDKIFTGYPMFKLKSEEGIPKNKIKSFPYLQTPYMALIRYFDLPNKIIDQFLYYAPILLDNYVSKKLHDVNILIAQGRAGLMSGKKIIKNGGIYFCDTGSSHVLYQQELLDDEYKSYNLNYHKLDNRIVDRALQEYETSSYISTPSQFTFDSFAKYGLEKKLFLNPYGSRISQFYPSKSKNYETFKVLFVAQINLRKGIFYLIEAFKKLKHPKKKLKIIGSISSDIKDLFLKSLTDEIEYVGIVNNLQLKDFYSEANVFVLPSIEEGLAMVMGEALACGCPVIATTNTGASSLFQDEKEGFIIPIRSSEHIYLKLQLLADSKDLQKKMSLAATALTKKINGWGDYGLRWVKKIKDITRINNII
jgi:glycosyltransferase involved in cell wall biosynthesis